MSKTDHKNTTALALLGDRALSYDQANLPAIQAAALQQLEEVRRLGCERGARAILAGIALCRVKASLKHGQFLPWLKANVGRGVSSCNEYMRLAVTFIDSTGVSKPDLLALPGDQTSLNLDGDESQRRFFSKLQKFVGQNSLSELLIKHGIKAQPKLGGARVPELGNGEDENSGAPAHDPEALYQSARDEIGGSIERIERLLISENRLQHLIGHPEEIRGVVESLRALTKRLEEAAKPLIDGTTTVAA